MITVIVAGGSGTRLWPLSTPDYPKHLLKVSGQSKTLVQSTYERVKPFSKDVYIVTEKSHAHHVMRQLPELQEDNFIIEPDRRGTASCIIAGLVRIAKKVDQDELIAFVHADHYVQNTEGFKQTFEIAEAVSRKENRIVLVGVEPDQPAVGFGYIEKGELLPGSDSVYNVAAFKEKPDYSLAEQYVQSGKYLWNCGYFVGSTKTFLRAMKNEAPTMKRDYELLSAAKTEDEYTKTYLGFKSVAVDYALIEQVKDLLVLPATFDWMDLGSYSDLHKAAESDKDGNHQNGNRVELTEVQNSFISNLEEKPLAVIGLSDVVVINTKDGIIVARKDMSQAIGDVAKKFQASANLAATT